MKRLFRVVHRGFVTALSLALTTGAAANESDSLAWEQAMETTVVTATRTPRLLKDVPVPTRVIAAEEIRRCNVATVAELLQQVLPGLEVSWAMSREASLNIGGFGGNSVLFLIDGERIAGETMNNPDYQRLTLDGVERIEIVRGAASALYGAGAVGGVVNIITRRAAKPCALTLKAQMGSHEEGRFGATLGNKAGAVGSVLNVSHTHLGRYEMRPFGDGRALVSGENRTWNVGERLTVKPSEKIELTARASYYFREREYDGSENNRYRDFSGGLKVAWRVAKGHDVEVAYAFDQYDKSDLSLVTRNDVRDYSNVQNSLRALYTGRLGDKVELVAGGDVMRDYLLSYMFADGGRSQVTADGFVQAGYRPAKSLELVGALRYDHFSASSSSSVTARIATRYTPRAGLTLRASYSGGFRAPTLKEMYMDFDMAGIFMIYGSRALNPERSHNVQLGVEGRAKGCDLSATVCYCAVDNRITTIWDPTAQGLYGNTGAMRYRNIGKMDVLNVEANAQRRWKHWHARLSYCYNMVHLRREEAYSDDTRPHSLTAFGGYDVRAGRVGRLAVDMSARYMSPLDVRELDEVSLQMRPYKTRYPGYALLKLNTQFTFACGVGVSLCIDNMLGYKPARYTYYSPKTTGATVLAGVSYEL